MIVPTFPDFVPLKLEDKNDYEQLIAEYPPFSDISFATLHIWWNRDGALGLSTLHGNLIIRYKLPFDDENSGLSLIGKQRLEETIGTIFDYLREQHESVKLVHVPEFVVKQLPSTVGLELKEEVDYNEYIVDSRALASLESSEHGKTRRKVNRFKREVEERDLEVKPLDLSSEEAREALFQAIIQWEHRQNSNNDPDKTEHHALKQTLSHAEHLGIRHLGLYLEGKLYAVVLYHRPLNKEYYIIHHLKVDYSIPYIFDYVTHHIANQAAQEDVAFINMEMDLGIESLRRHKLGLRPVDFFRKYTITPS